MTTRPKPATPPQVAACLNAAASLVADCANKARQWHGEQWPPHVERLDLLAGSLLAVADHIRREYEAAINGDQPQ
jgi:hypothetical protein